MASFKHVTIDWSKPSSSFIQVDAYTKTPIPDLYNYKPSHTSWNVLTTKDILYYDIDIYLKFYKRSLPKDEPPPPQDDFSSPDIVTHDKDINPSPDILSTTPYDDNIPKSDLLEASSSINTVTPSKKDITSSIPPPTHNDSKINNTPFSVSFKKFHVTHKQRSGYNKIYEFRRSRSFFFELVDQIPDTNDIHLRIHTNDYHMSRQRVIPRRIQHKYFNLIRKKLLERIDIIKSREQKMDQHNRSTKTFFNFSYKKYRFYFGIFIPCNHNIKSNLIQSTCRIPSPIIMSNRRHACGAHFTNIYREITISSSKKEIDKDALAHPINNKVSHANLLHARWSSKHTKKVVSYRTGRSYNVSYTARGSDLLQVSGHKHIYSKRLWNFQESLSSNPKTAKLQNERYERSQRRVFKKYMPPSGGDLTFTDKWRISRHKKFVSSNIRDVRCPIKHLQYTKAREIPWQKDYNFLLPYDGLIPTVAPYNPRPKGFIPIKYRNIIPPDPIYSTDGSFIVPGSTQWFTYMNNLEKRTRLQSAEKEAARLKKQEIFDHGSTEKHHALRQEMKRRLTELTNFYHEGLSIYRNDLIHHANEPPKWYTGYIDELYSTTNDNYGHFMRRYNDKRSTYRNDVQMTLNTKKGRITDDTRRAEFRPNKRDCPFFNSIGNASDPSPSKKLRYRDERPYTLLVKGRVLTA
ncbi:hypothetical protein RhiirA4_486118 [Rhizophagus irregularis]|uniref:DUF8211 domain-containing protein n=1 Tax=Rhizophagus irregularis TaxID=588596 RepID=A0A2I1HR22_9GLOM|nr:hypothetical protein RhiirA4_486118 [Rhizophagus irregularis]